MPEPLTDAYLQQCEQAARRFQGAWTGTSGDLAARLIHCVAEVRRLRIEAAMKRIKAAIKKENAPPISYD